MSKPPSRWVPSDDCAVTIDGETYYPHEGERVKIIGSSTVGELQSLWAFNNIAVDLGEKPSDDASDDDLRAYNRQRSRQLSDAYERLCSAIAQRVVDWDWTDDEGSPLPKPDRTTGPLKALRDQELYYLRSVIQGESTAARGNGSRPSATTSSARGQSRSRRG